MTTPVDKDLVDSLEKSDADFMSSSDVTKCTVCGAPVFPQDDWVPHDREYDFIKGRFTFPKNVAHESCAQDKMEP